MRILVVGAGAIGGYFGGRLLQAGNDVTFLVRPKRASELASAGLVIKSPNGDVTLKNPPTVQADKLAEKFDVVLLSCKAFDLEDAIKSFAPAVGPKTAIIPLLNGMLHLNVLDQKFGADRVLGGLCAIAVTLNEAREVVQLAPMQSLNFGERDGAMSERVRAIAKVFESGKFGAVASEHIMQDMWEKWVFLASLAASTSLMRTSVGNILAVAGGKDFLLGMLDECSAIAKASGHAPTGPFFQRTSGMLTTEGSPMTASMFRDIKAGLPVEADHVIGDLVARADAAEDSGAEAAHRLYASQGVREAAGVICILPWRALEGRIDARKARGWGDGRSSRTPLGVDRPSPHPVSHFAALTRADPPLQGAGKQRPSRLQMREIMRERLDLFLAERKRDIGHRRHRAAGSHARFVIPQRLHEILLALAGDAGHRLGAGVAIGMACRRSAGRPPLARPWLKGPDCRRAWASSAAAARRNRRRGCGCPRC